MTIVTPCGPDEYPHENLCCKLCPAGHHVSKHCSVNHGIAECAECESRTFSAHPNGETTCQSCALCREDQEVVVECSWTSEQLCRCKQGVFYCDSAHCTESCFRCSRCPEDMAVLHPCNATADTVCAQTKAEPGNSNWIYVLVVVIVIVFIIGVGAIYLCCKRNDVLRHVAKFFKSKYAFTVGRVE
ncbi:PREDICTED: tumor necrosis factor receptor superfamily member 26-like [Galeopterus variegatus]|uniref:Tumor necrosis factor receptor superfamily member 26-like n=1 Tax=Galeopterus variegatus TaxID=482537 RepID=A0ABM0RP69_GALVR|nr:PREDICTED: tumor necrosis factor receptor superfamily member 26-like [Galeopterus variegatus]